jgi:hypothetical protein
MKEPALMIRSALRRLPVAASFAAALIAVSLFHVREARSQIWDVQWKPGEPRIMPIVLLRPNFIFTDQRRFTVTDSTGKQIVIDTSKMDPSMFGHREGFVLENVELGLRGRFDPWGLYYQAKVELVPREKDGNRSSDYLKDAYFGWNRYPFIDLSVGRMKVPFSQVNMKPTELMPLAYPPTLDVLTIKRQLGLKIVAGDPWKAFRLTLGVFNSVAIATEMIKSFDQLLYVARGDLRVDTILRLAKAHFLDFEWNIGGGMAYVEQNYDPPTTHRWIGVDTHLHLWRFTVEAEFDVKDFYTGDTTTDGKQVPDRGWGWHVDLTTHMWPGKIDLTLRYEQVDGDEAVRGATPTLSTDELAKQKREWFTAGVTAFLTPQVKIEFNYIMRRQLEGFHFNTDVFLLLAQYSM